MELLMEPVIILILITFLAALAFIAYRAIQSPNMHGAWKQSQRFALLWEFGFTKLHAVLLELSSIFIPHLNKKKSAGCLGMSRITPQRDLHCTNDDIYSKLELWSS